MEPGNAACTCLGMASIQFLRPGHIIRARGQSWVVHRHVAGVDGSVLEVRGRGIENHGKRTVFLLPFEPIERLPSSETPRIVRPRTWRRLVRPMLAAATPSYDALRSPARAALAVLPFQLEPVLAIVRGLAARVLIADEVGLGKTIQAGLIISELIERQPDGRVLVVTPAGLREQWQTELRQRFARESTLLDSASVAQHAAEWNGNPWSVPGIVLTSLDYVKRPEVVRALEALIWDVVVFDEAHGLAGRSDRATAAALLGRSAISQIAGLRHTLRRSRHFRSWSFDGRVATLACPRPVARCRSAYGNRRTNWRCTPHCSPTRGSSGGRDG
jgi:hypothetical protein